jgi:molybdate transport system substrate-binding protein
MNRRSTILVAAAAFAVFAGGARAADIAMIGQPQTQFVLSALLPTYEAATGNKVNVSYEGGAAAVAKVKGGGIDLAIMAPEQIDELLKEGKMVGTRADVFISGVGLAVKAGARKPDIGTVEALKAALLAAKSVARSNARSGQYFASVLERIGIAEQMKPKMIVVDSPVGAAAAKGDAEIAVQQVTELMPVPGVDVVGPLPAELQTRIFYSAGIPAGAKQTEAAKQLIRFFVSPEAAPTVRAKGLQPGAL